jgi:hypothetical protein
LRAEDFSCSLSVLFGGLGKSKLQFLIKKIKIKFPAVNFFSILGHPDPQLEKCWIRIRIKSMRIRNPALKEHTTEVDYFFCDTNCFGTGPLSMDETFWVFDFKNLKFDSKIESVCVPLVSLCSTCQREKV